MGRLETWLLRHARGELHYQNGFGNSGGSFSDSCLIRSLLLLLESVSIPPSLPPSEGSIHYRLLLDPDNINVDHLNMECVVVKSV